MRMSTGRGGRSIASSCATRTRKADARRRSGQDHPAATRVTLDLTGLPPTPAEVDDFLVDNRPDAYERVVDRLLAFAALR